MCWPLVGVAGRRSALCRAAARRGCRLCLGGRDEDGDVRVRMQWHGRFIRRRSGSVVPLLKGKHGPVLVGGVQNTGDSRDNTLLEQCEVANVFRIYSLALRTSI